MACAADVFKLICFNYPLFLDNRTKFLPMFVSLPSLPVQNPYHLSSLSYRFCNGFFPPTFTIGPLLFYKIYNLSLEVSLPPSIPSLPPSYLYPTIPWYPFQVSLVTNSWTGFPFPDIAPYPSYP